MKRIEFKNKGTAELSSMLEELREKLMKLNFELGEKKLKDVSQIKKVKRDIARILSELNNLKKQNGKKQ